MNRLICSIAVPAAALAFAACGLPNASEQALGELSQELKGATSSAPSLGAASSFAVLGASTVTCTNASSVTGNVGVSPGTAITGFNPDCTVSGTLHAGDAVAAQAHNDLVTAYNGLTQIACQHNLTGQDLGGQTLAPGVYCFDSSVGITGQLTLDGGGDSNAVWIFQVGSTLTTASNASIVMAGSGKPCNAFWQIGSSATIGTNTDFQGNLLAYASITLTSGSNLVGRALALNAAVTSDANAITLSGCSGSGPGTPPPFCAGTDRVTGGGHIAVGSGKGKATFAIAGGIRNGAFIGHLTFIGHTANGPKVQSQSVTGYVLLDATTRRIQGTAKVNGQPGFTYEVDVSDNGKPGTNDTFSLFLSNGYSASGVLAGGNIQLHTKQGYTGACKSKGRGELDEAAGSSDDDGKHEP